MGWRWFDLISTPIVFCDCLLHSRDTMIVTKYVHRRTYSYTSRQTYKHLSIIQHPPVLVLATVTGRPHLNPLIQVPFPISKCWQCSNKF